MSRLFIALFLLVAVFGQTKIASSSVYTNLAFPAGASAIETSLNAAYPDVIDGAKWIWSDTASNQVIIEHIFWTKCNGPIELSVAAYGSWEVYLNGFPILSGSNWKTASEYSWTPKCGKQILKIVVKKTVKDRTFGVIFKMEQDKSKCVCKENGWWNPETCRCECRDACPCNSKQGKFWWGYPVCGCKCSKPPRQSTGGIVGTTLNLKASALCPYGQYFN